MRFIALTERARRLNAAADRPSLPLRLDRRRRQPGCRSTSTAHATNWRRSAAESESAWRELLFNASFSDRLPRHRHRHTEDALALGAVGPAARASRARRRRARNQHRARLRRVHDDRPPPRRRRRPGTTGAARARGAADLRPARLAARPPGRALRRASRRENRPADRRGTRREPARRDTLHRRARRRTASPACDLRTGSYANWPVVAHAAAGNLLPDFPLINKSFELCYACADR